MQDTVQMPPPRDDLPTGEIVTYAQFLSAKARRDLLKVTSGETPPRGYPWAYLFEPTER